MEGGGGGGTQKIFIQEGTALKSSPLPFIYHFLHNRYPFRMPFINKWNPYIMESLEFTTLLTTENVLYFNYEYTTLN